LKESTLVDLPHLFCLIASPAMQLVAQYFRLPVAWTEDCFVRVPVRVLWFICVDWCCGFVIRLLQKRPIAFWRIQITYLPTETDRMRGLYRPRILYRMCSISYLFMRCACVGKILDGSAVFDINRCSIRQMFFLDVFPMVQMVISPSFPLLPSEINKNGQPKFPLHILCVC